MNIQWIFCINQLTYFRPFDTQYSNDIEQA